LFARLSVCLCALVFRKPETGIRYLVAGQFVDDRPSAVARFLLTRKGLSKQMIGDYLGNLQRPFNMEVLRYVLRLYCLLPVWLAAVRSHRNMCDCLSNTGHNPTGRELSG